MDSYKSIQKTPMMTFGESYTGTFEITEESRKALDELLKETDEDAVSFFDVFEHDLLCCLTSRCEECHLKVLRDIKGLEWKGTELVMPCLSLLADNARRMIDNQKRMMIQFNKQRQEKDEAD